MNEITELFCKFLVCPDTKDKKSCEDVCVHSAKSGLELLEASKHEESSSKKKTFVGLGMGIVVGGVLLARWLGNREPETA